MLYFWEDPETVVGRDGRSYQIQLVAAWMGTEFDYRTLLLGVFPVLHLLWMALGRAWRVEVIEMGKRPVWRRGLPEPFVDVIAVTRSKRAAERQASNVYELIASGRQVVPS